MAEQRITTKPTVSQLLDEDYLFINHDGALRQVRKDAADIASAAGLAAEATARQQFMTDETLARQAFETAETAAREQFEENLTEANEEFVETVDERMDAAESIVYGAFPIGTASGDIASFNDGADNIPMKSLMVAIVPKQAGSGDPSPNNVRPITGWTDADVIVRGKNLLDPDSSHWSARQTTYRYINGVVPENTIARFTITDKDTSVDVSGCSMGFVYNNLDNSSPLAFRWAMQNGVVQSITTNVGHDDKLCTNVFIYPYDEASFNKIFARYNVMVEIGTTATAYVPYTGHTTPVPLGQTVYGGEVDVVSGEMIITHAMVDMGSLNWGQYNATPSGQGTHNIFAAILSGADEPDISFTPVCSQYKGMSQATSNTSAWQKGNNTCCFLDSGDKRLYVRDDAHESDTLPDFKAYLSGVYLVYKLATPPITVQLTPAEVRTLLGTNNIWADCGLVEVEYRADPTLAYAELQALILENM